MKFIIEKEVFEKFPNLIVYIPIIKGFDNTKGKEESLKLINNCSLELQKKYKSIDELIDDPRISSYFELFKEFGANPKKVKPTHYALTKRILEGGNLPDINSIVNIYNALSIKYITPFGGEDLDTVYGDFRLKFAKGDEHWKGIGEEFGQNPPKNSLIWEDDYDVSTVALNWRQCERTKLCETSSDGYFIMDGFEGINDENIETAASDLVDTVTKLCGGVGEIYVLNKENPFVEIDFESKSTDGVDIPKVVTQSTSEEKTSQTKKNIEYVYDDGTVENILQREISSALNLQVETVMVSRIQNSKFGDYTSPIAMQIAKKEGKNPMDVAEIIVSKIDKQGIIDKIEAVKPGFINIFVNESYVKDELLKIDKDFGNFDLGKGEKIMIEYGQPNTHKAITVGHVKSAITGLSVARLYEALGYDVIHANYFGDLGPYVAKTMYCLMLKNSINNVDELTEEKVNDCIKYLENVEKEKGLKGVKDEIASLYREGNKMSEAGGEDEKNIKEINNLLFDKQNELVNSLYLKTRAICINYQTEFFNTLGVKYDRQYPESEVFEIGKKIVTENIGKIFIKDAGAIIFPGERYGMTRWVFLTSDGNPTYHGKDLGLARLKFTEYPDLKFALIMTSVEQNEYFKALMKVISLLYPELEGKYLHEGFGWLLFNNKKTSSRGVSFTYDDMLNEAIENAKSKIDALKTYTEEERENISKVIALAGIKFNILSHEFHKDINYDPKNFTSLSGFSAPYIIYSYTRAMSVLNKITEIKQFSLKDVYNEKEEIDLIKKLLKYPSIVKVSALERKTHLLCEYLYELANTFNSFYTTQQILNAENEDIKNSRLLLAQKTAMVIKKGLYLLGIDTIDKM